jgi:hypothetical protein
MQKEVDFDKYEVYRYRGDEELYVAIPRTYRKFIDAAVEQYGQLESVPNMKTVRGVFVKRAGKAFRYADRVMQENDITISQLGPADKLAG